MKNTNRRLASIIIAIAIVAILVAIYLSGALLPEDALRADFSQKFQPPSLGEIAVSMMSQPASTAFR